LNNIFSSPSVFDTVLYISYQKRTTSDAAVFNFERPHPSSILYIPYQKRTTSGATVFNSTLNHHTRTSESAASRGDQLRPQLQPQLLRMRKKGNHCSSRLGFLYASARVHVRHGQAATYNYQWEENSADWTLRTVVSKKDIGLYTTRLMASFRDVRCSRKR
jgi:hypothetical protein